MDLSQKILSDVTVYAKYARYNHELKRRETWDEIINRNKGMHIAKYPNLSNEIEEVYERSVRTKKVLPSMRSLQFAGKAIERNPSRIYNCAYLPIEDTRAFSEIMFLLLGGTGVGYSVQYRHVDKLPVVVGPSGLSRRYIVGDSIEGWADAIRVLVESYFRGKRRVEFDFSEIRAKGTELVVSGGKAPGPDPLRECLQRIVSVLDGAIGRRLRPIEAHDIACYEADAVLAGGIRRAAMISLFSYNDEEMINAKSSSMDIKLLEVGEYNKEKEEYKVVVEGAYGSVETTLSKWEVDNYNGKLGWWTAYAQRGRANNSVVLHRTKTTSAQFAELWERVRASGAGEPGFYWTNNFDWGTNPCCEIALRPYQFCNLTEINTTDISSQEDFNQRARDASFLGTLQAGYTSFHYLRPIWQQTTEEDALVGVGMTGIASGAIFPLDEQEAANVANDTNLIISASIGIKPAARVTTVKPSGTSSLVVGSSSGIHGWHAPYYLRRLRFGKDETIYKYLNRTIPVLVEDEFFRPDTQAVVGIPQKAPDTAIFRTESALSLLERTRRYNVGWVRQGHRRGDNTNNVSVTISIRENEWDEVGQWMWENKDTYNGISVLPYDGGTYKQTPFEDITEEEYYKLSANLSDIDLSLATEDGDYTDLTGEAACAGSGCEIDFDLEGKE
jgi:ribonucleoside-diphosphate reductase alpha chain